MSASVQRKLEQAHHSLASGKVSAAVALCESVLERAPRNPDALWLLGTARLMEGRADLAVAMLERAVAVVPERGSALESLGLAYLMTADYAPAERVLRRALALPHAPTSVRMRLGAALLHQGKHDAAIQELERVLAADPEDADARLNLGRAYGGSGRWSEALRAFEHIVSRFPDHIDALFNLGIASSELGDLERARSCFERIVASDPANGDARERLAALYLAMGRYGEARTHLQQLVRARPREAAACVALAEASFQVGTLDEAYDTARKAVELDPSEAGAYSVLARIHYVRGELDRAIAILEEAGEAAASGPLLGLKFHLLHRIGDWPRWRAAWEKAAAQIETAANVGSPFSLLCETTTPQQQLTYTKRWAAARFANIRPSPAVAHSSPRGERRLRVGYFSSDFQDHAVAHLMIHALEMHDRQKFEIFAYSYGPDDGSAMRARVRAAVEHFIDVAWETDDAVVKRMRDDELDLLIDLKGYTVGDRLTVMAHRPCAVQVTWLGYPGTCGADFVDYVIADEYIIPKGAEEFYSERVLRMPLCYQPNDRERTIVPARSRTQYGLPENAFVFCCFTQAVKILPEIFACWIRLLSKVSGSVLWVLEDNVWSSANLKGAATAAGMDPERIVLARRVSNDEHLARFQAADIALDTFPYTSHTTASDSLWMGCPLVALCGETFAARVSASIVSACGFPELVTQTLDDYEALAYRLATDAAYLKNLRVCIADARDTSPLFDSQKFARDLEALYLQIA